MGEISPWLSEDQKVREAWLDSHKVWSYARRTIKDLWTALDEANRERDALKAEVERLRLRVPVHEFPSAEEAINHAREEGRLAGIKEAAEEFDCRHLAETKGKEVAQ